MKTISELVGAMIILKDHCKSQVNCESCVLHEPNDSNSCYLKSKIPMRWSFDKNDNSCSTQRVKSIFK